VAKREWEVTSSWDLEIELLISPRDWVWKKKSEIYCWVQDLYLIKKYIDVSGHPREMLMNAIGIVEDLGRFKLTSSENTLISHFKLFREFFQLLRSIFFSNCRPDFVHNSYGRLESLSKEIVSGLSYRDGRGIKTSLLVDLQVMVLLVYYVYHIIPSTNSGEEGGSRPRNIPTPITWQDKHRLVYILQMLTMSTTYCNLIKCPGCRERVLGYTRDSKGPKCVRCQNAPGYFFALGDKGKGGKECHTIFVYCKNCCNSFGMCNHCKNFIIRGKCGCA